MSAGMQAAARRTHRCRRRFKLRWYGIFSVGSMRWPTPPLNAVTCISSLGESRGTAGGEGVPVSTRGRPTRGGRSSEAGPRSNALAPRDGDATTTGLGGASGAEGVLRRPTVLQQGGGRARRRCRRGRSKREGGAPHGRSSHTHVRRWREAPSSESFLGRPRTLGDSGARASGDATGSAMDPLGEGDAPKCYRATHRSVIHSARVHANRHTHTHTHTQSPCHNHTPQTEGGGVDRVGGRRG